MDTKEIIKQAQQELLDYDRQADELYAEFELLESKIGATATEGEVVIVDGKKQLPSKAIITTILTGIALFVQIIEEGVPLVRKLFGLFKWATGAKFEAKLENVLSAAEAIAGWLKGKITL